MSTETNIPKGTEVSLGVKSTVKNSYPELPEVPFFRTQVEMPLVAIFAKSLLKKYEPKFIWIAYAIFRNESSNGVRGVNNNYAGIQADVGRWTGLPAKPVATCIKKDNGGAIRRFLCFDSDGYKTSFELIVIKSMDRNMVTAMDYFAKWVSNTKQTKEDIAAFQSMIDAAAKNFV